jgi:peroxiredoxin
VSSRLGSAAIALLLIAGALWVLFGSERPAAPVGEGHPAPDFTLSALDGGPISLSALRGRVVLLNFWATWCKPCEDEMPAMQGLYDTLAGSGFELLAISVDEGDDEVRAFQKRLALGFPILRDPEKRAATAYQTFRFPESWLIGPDGIVVARYIGPREWDGPLYVERIRKLIETVGNP